MENQYEEINLMELAGHILKKWWLIVLLMLVSVGSAYWVTTMFVTPIYEASTTVFIGKESAKLADISLMDIQVGSQLVTDYTELVETNQVLERVISELALNAEPKDVRDNLTVSIIKESRFMRIAYQDPDAKLAVKVADKVSDILKLKAEEIVGVKNVVIVDYAKAPVTAVSPSIMKNAGISGVLGMMLALSVIFLKLVLDNTLKIETDIEKVLGLPVLGVIPRFKGEKR